MVEGPTEQQMGALSGSQSAISGAFRTGVPEDSIVGSGRMIEGTVPYVGRRLLCMCV